MRPAIVAIAALVALSLAACGAKEEAAPASNLAETGANATAVQMQAAADAARAAAESGSDAAQTTASQPADPLEPQADTKPEEKH